MSIEVVYQTHSLSEDNERGIATGWLPGRLSARGREDAARMGLRRRGDPISAVFSSDLHRAAETAQIAFGDTDIPILYDWRLRECDFGRRNGTPVGEIEKDRAQHIDLPYPGGESLRQAVLRVTGLLTDLPTRWAGQRVLIIGHMATYRALEQMANNATLEELVATTFIWREDGWEYVLG